MTFPERNQSSSTWRIKSCKSKLLAETFYISMSEGPHRVLISGLANMHRNPYRLML